MKIITQSLALAAVLVGLFVGSARAEGVIIANVPFPFVCDHREFPAGKYDINRIAGGGKVVSIVGTSNRSAAYVLTLAAGGSDPAGDEPSLVFTRHENQYQLSQIWRSRTEGRELPKSGNTGKTAQAGAHIGLADAQSYVLAATSN